MNTVEVDAVVARANELLEGVTPGPWVVGRNQHPDDPEWDIESHAIQFDDPRGIVFYGVEQGEADARFIAAARMLVPELVARILMWRNDRYQWKSAWQSTLHKLEETEGEVEKLRSDYQRAVHDWAENDANVLADSQRLAEENEKLRGALETICDMASDPSHGPLYAHKIMAVIDALNET